MIVDGQQEGSASALSILSQGNAIMRRGRFLNPIALVAEQNIFAIAHDEYFFYIKSIFA